MARHCGHPDPSMPQRSCPIDSQVLLADLLVSLHLAGTSSCKDHRSLPRALPASPPATRGSPLPPSSLGQSPRTFHTASGKRDAGRPQGAQLCSTHPFGLPPCAGPRLGSVPRNAWFHLQPHVVPGTPKVLLGRWHKGLSQNTVLRRKSRSALPTAAALSASRMIPDSESGKAALPWVLPGHPAFPISPPPPPAQGQALATPPGPHLLPPILPLPSQSHLPPEWPFRDSCDTPLGCWLLRRPEGHQKSTAALQVQPRAPLPRCLLCSHGESSLILLHTLDFTSSWSHGSPLPLCAPPPPTPHSQARESVWHFASHNPHPEVTWSQEQRNE